MTIYNDYSVGILLPISSLMKFTILAIHLVKYIMKSFAKMSPISKFIKFA